jgi:hypothetical protein
MDMVRFERAIPIFLGLDKWHETLASCQLIPEGPMRSTTERK